MGVIARRVRVFGRVQGVFFRAFTSDLARRFGVTGFVRNCADGSVEAVLQGEPEAVYQVIEGVRQGPPMARVDGVEVEEEPVADRSPPFVIER